MVTQIASLIIVVVLFVISLFFRKLKYLICASGLILIGLLLIFFDIGKIAFDIGQYPIVNFAAYFLVLSAGKDLVKSGFRKKRHILKYPSIILGVAIIVLTTLPTLNRMNIVSVNVPVYPVMIDAILYLISGGVLLIGTVGFLDNN